MANRQDEDEITVYSIYAEPAQVAELKVPFAYSIEQAKKAALDELRKHMQPLLPNIELNQEEVDIYPVPPATIKTVGELSELNENVTIIIWPAGRHVNPLKDALLEAQLKAIDLSKEQSAPGNTSTVSTMSKNKKNKKEQKGRASQQQQQQQHVEQGRNPLDIVHELKLLLQSKLDPVDLKIQSLLEELGANIRVMQTEIMELRTEVVALKNENKELRTEIEALKNENTELRTEIVALRNENKELRNDNTEFRDLLRKSAIANNRLLLRELLNKGKDAFSVICGYLSWYEMSRALGPNIAKEEIRRKMGQDPPNGWDGQMVDSLVTLTIDPNDIRGRGDETAYTISEDETADAIACLPEGKDRRLLHTLHEYVFQKI